MTATTTAWSIGVDADWFTLDKVKALIALCTFLAGIASYMGYGKFQMKQENQATREQVTNIVNHYYNEGCKP